MVESSGSILHIGLSPVDLNLMIQTISYRLLSDLQVVMSLQVDPKLSRHPKKAAKPQCCIRRNGPFALHYFINASRRNGYVLGKPILRDAHRFQKLFKQNLSRMNWSKVSSHDTFHSVVIGNFHIESISVPPAETDSPLVVYSDAVLAGPIAPKRLQSIPRGNSKRFQIRRGVQHEQFHMTRPLDILRQSLRKSTLRNLLRFLAGERLYHGRKILTPPVINVKRSLFPFSHSCSVGCLKL